MNSPILNDSLNETESDVPSYTLYVMYKNAGPIAALIVPAVLMTAVAIPGIMFNALLIFVTAKDKSLRGSTNFLLALTAFFEMMHQTTHFVFLFITVSGINFVPYFMALRVQMHAIFGVTAAHMGMVSTAADRLFAVMFPIKYIQMTDSAPYLALHTVLFIISGTLMSAYAWRFSLAHPFLPVTGYISDLLVLDMEIIFVLVQIFCAINVMLYVLVWVVIKLRSGPIAENDPQEKLFKSLVVIVGTVIGGYVFNNVWRLGVHQFAQLDPTTVWWADVFGGIILNIAASAETPILYIFSSKYKSVINKELAHVCCCCFPKKAQKLGTLVPAASAVKAVNAISTLTQLNAIKMKRNEQRISPI